MRDQRVAQGQLGEERVPRLHAARARLVVDGRSPVGGHRSARAGLPRLRRHDDRRARAQDRRRAGCSTSSSQTLRAARHADRRLAARCSRPRWATSCSSSAACCSTGSCSPASSGLVEIDVSHLPDLVIETARVPMRSGFGVVGRIDGGAFAVTAGTIEPWGLTNMTPGDARRLADREPARSAEDAARDAARTTELAALHRIGHAGDVAVDVLALAPDAAATRGARDGAAPACGSRPAGRARSAAMRTLCTVVG